MDEKTDDIRLYPVSGQVDCIAVGQSQIGDGIAFQHEGIIHFNDLDNQGHLL